jgi:outer membrane receptor for ferrienterochelin and colicin
MKTSLCAFLSFLFFSFSLVAQIPDSIFNQVDTLLSDLEQSLIEFEENIDIAASKSILTAKEIQDRGYDNLDELLSSVQGTYLTNEWTASQIGFRGISPSEINNQRVLILLDNIPLNNPMTGQAPTGIELRGIPMEHIESVTIIRSPMAILYGNSAMNGVIRIKTKKAKKGFGVVVDRGSFGKYDVGLSLGQVWEKTSFSLSSRLGSILGQDIYIPEYNFAVPEGDQMDYSGLQLKLNHGNLSLKGSYFQREGAIIFAHDPVIAPDSISEAFFEGGTFFEKSLFADISYDGAINENQSIHARLFLNYDLAARQLEDVWGSGEILEKNRIQENIWTGVEYQHLFKLQQNHQLLLGTEFWHIPVSNYTASELNGPDTNLDFSYWTLGIFAHDSYQFKNGFAINGGIRADINSFTDPVFSPQLTMLYALTEKTALRIGYSRGYRLPSILETDVIQEFQPFPNPDLIPEISNSLELAWQQQFGKGLNMDLAFYYQQLDGLILNSLTMFQSDNDATLEAMGLEAGLSVDLPEGIQTYLYYNFQFNAETNVNTPSPLCKFGVTVPFLKHFTLFAEGQYEGSRLTWDGTYTLPYFLMNSNLRFSPRVDTSKKNAKWLNQSSISFRVYNLFDQFYQHPSRQELQTRFMGQMGRTWQTKLVLQF